jgi:flagellar biosynthesis repressor protein FlbT
VTVALRLVLKPHERLIVGGAVLRNGGARTELMIENTVPVLRERDILTPSTATTPCGMIYLAIQLMYVEPQLSSQQREAYDTLIRDVLTAAPSTRDLISRINADVVAGRYYHALKTARELLTYEHTLLANAHERS